jgi:uncharacterized protein YkwD
MDQIALLKRRILGLSGSAANAAAVHLPAAVASLLFLGILFWSLSISQAEDISGNDYPSWEERTMIVFTNAVRMAPEAYREKYMASHCPEPCSILTAYPPVSPLYWNPDLNEAARYHAEDMLLNGCFSHNSCDGTLWYQRIRSFCPEAVYLAENIAAGLEQPWEALNLLLWDWGADDYASGAGHRTNIMRSSMNAIGTGYASGTSGYRDYWVQDFSSLSDQPTEPIAEASHAFLEWDTITFLLNYYDSTGDAPEEVVVIIDDEEYPLALDLGEPSMGTYQVTLPLGEDCRGYYFLVTDGAHQTWRYPGLGEFLTYKEGLCKAAFDDDSDEDGILDEEEDANQDGILDPGETDPFRIDTDRDGIQDGTEQGFTSEDIGADTNPEIFQPDLDPFSTTDPRKKDTDGDGWADGAEDENLNGALDPGESDPAVHDRSDKPLTFFPPLLNLL